jgi:hypothetical protein
MNHKQNHMKGRQRGRNGGGGGGGGKPRPPGVRNPNFDGNNRPRGNAQQLMEKYLALARDASSAGDRVMAENYFQHADHYYRVLNARFEQNGQPRRPEGQGQPPQQHERQGGGYQGPGGYNDRPYEGEQQPPHHHSGYGGQSHQQPQQQHHTQAPDSQPGTEAEIGLPPGVLGGEPPVETANEQPEADESPDGGGDQNRGRHGSRRRRGRGDRPFANAGE